MMTHVLVRVVVGIALASVAGGCESAKEKCDAAREAAHDAWGPVVDVALATNQRAQDAREAAIAEVTEKAMDLGNLRSDAAQARFGGTEHDAFVGVEVSIGAVIGAMLAADELWAVDAEAANAVVAAVDEELEGRYATVMTAALDGEDVESSLTEAGDACSTRLQLLVREQPERVRVSVLGAFQAMEAEEGEPPADLAYDDVKSAWRSYVAAARAADASQAALDAAVAAREATSGPAARATETAEAVPEGPDVLGGAVAASRAVTEACSSL
jgi:hypothetical protein